MPGHEFSQRGHGQDEHSDGNNSSDEASSAGERSRDAGGSAGCEKPAEAAQPVPKAVLAARASKVFDTKAGWPAEVREPLLAPVVTNQVVRDAIEVCDELRNRDGPALSQAFGNSQVCGPGWWGHWRARQHRSCAPGTKVGHRSARQAPAVRARVLCLWPPSQRVAARSHRWKRAARHQGGRWRRSSAQSVRTASDARASVLDLVRSFF